MARVQEISLIAGHSGESPYLLSLSANLCCTFLVNGLQLPKFSVYVCDRNKNSVKCRMQWYSYQAYDAFQRNLADMSSNSFCSLPFPERILLMKEVLRNNN